MDPDRPFAILKTGKRQSLAIALLALSILGLLIFGVVTLAVPGSGERTTLGQVAWYTGWGSVAVCAVVSMLLLALRKHADVDPVRRTVHLTDGREFGFGEVLVLVAAVRRFAGDKHEAWGLALLTTEVEDDLLDRLQQDRGAGRVAESLFAAKAIPGTAVLTDDGPKRYVLDCGMRTAEVLGVPLFAVDGRGRVSELVSEADEARGDLVGG